MVEYIRYLNIPSVPNNLILDSIEEIEALESVWPQNYEHPERFLLKKNANKDLEEFLRPYFDFDITTKVYYQIIRSRSPKHIDFNRTSCYNYIINTGGEKVSTSWFNLTNSKLLEHKEIIPDRVWHKIQVDVPHVVQGIIQDRFALTVFEWDPGKTPADILSWHEQGYSAEEISRKLIRYERKIIDNSLDIE
jgi:hypothetical protein